MSQDIEKHPIIQRLIVEGLLSEASALEIVAAAPRSREKLGEVLLRARILNFKQLMDILVKQAERPTARIGELAVELGYCSDADVRWALLRQAATQRHPLDEIVARRLFADRVLLEFLVEYIKRLDALDAETDAAPASQVA